MALKLIECCSRVVREVLEDRVDSTSVVGPKIGFEVYSNSVLMNVGSDP
jgi:hypothetical protein